jgi:proton-coupled amino acid transporter
MFPAIRSNIGVVEKHPIIGELIFRTLMVLVTFLVAELVPKLSLLLSFIGALFSTGKLFIFYCYQTSL